MGFTLISLQKGVPIPLTEMNRLKAPKIGAMRSASFRILREKSTISRLHTHHRYGQQLCGLPAVAPRNCGEAWPPSRRDASALPGSVVEKSYRVIIHSGAGGLAGLLEIVEAKSKPAVTLINREIDSDDDNWWRYGEVATCFNALSSQATRTGHFAPRTGWRVDFPATGNMFL